MVELEGCGTACDARERYTDGRNCAEAVIGASARQGGPADSLGSGFTGGIGHSGCVCGALAGGVAILGEHAEAAGLEPVATRLLAEELSAELHSRFTEEFGAACCRVIKRGQVDGSDEWLSGCAEITEWTTREVVRTTAESRDDARGRWSVRDLVSTARRASAGVLAFGAIAAALSALAGDAAILVFSAATIAGGLAAVVLEVGGPRARRGGRALRTVGVLVAAMLAVAAVLAPLAATAHITGLLGGAGLIHASARLVLVVATCVAAATVAFGWKRYR